MSNPSNCVRVGGIQLDQSPNEEAIDVAVSGNYAYVAATYAGLQVIDVSDPAHCVRAGEYASSESFGVSVTSNLGDPASWRAIYLHTNTASPIVWAAPATNVLQFYRARRLP